MRPAPTGGGVQYWLTMDGGAVTAERASDWGSHETRLVDRAQLLAKLDRAVTCKVTVISAPAGSGKTSLLRAWADRSAQTHRVAFVSVVRDQRDEQLFWLALLEAIRIALDKSASDEPLVATPGFNPGAMVDRVLADLAESDHRARLVLVIDDLHELTSAGAQTQLTRVLTELPAHVHVVLGTRRDLQLRLHQLRLAGELSEIRAADLRFTEVETRELLAISGVVLSNAAIQTLQRRTEGWAAGLRLAAIALAEHPDPERFVAEFSGSNRTVADYLIAELLERQPPRVQRLLLRTSLLDRVNGELADLLTGSSGSEQLLLDLEDANAFVVSLDPQRTWFRFHQLFGELLRLELRRNSPAEVPQLHRLAARWFADHAEPIQAIRHLQAAGDWSQAARLLADHAFSLTLDGHSGTLEALLSAFPRGAPADDAELALVYATRDVVQNRLDDAAARLQVAEQHARTSPVDRQHRLQIAVASLKLELATRRGNFVGVIEQVKLDQLSAPVTARSNEDVALGSDLRAFALLVLGIVETWTLHLADAEQHLLDGAALARKIGRPYLEATCLARLGFASKLRSFAIARERCEAAIAFAERHGWGNDRVIVPALASLGGTLIWTGEFEAAQPLLERAAKVSGGDVEPGTRLLVHLATGMLHASRGELRAALEEFSAAERTQSLMMGQHALSGQVTGWTVATSVRLGMLDAAHASLAELNAEHAASGEIRNAIAVLQLAEGNPSGALSSLVDVLDGRAHVIHDFTRVEACLLAARAHVELRDHRAAKATVERALALAEPDRLILPFVMTGSRDLLEALPRHETAHAALIIDILDVMRGTSANAPQVLPAVQELTETELRVLRFLPTNLTRPEIARELYLSVNTVNTHVRNIYAKLDARDRTSAVERARELRLLSVGVPR
jgi:LuxR family transcriptional regulator, maltose regulon positive regulatory protein